MKCSLAACTYNCAGVSYAFLLFGRNPEIAEVGKYPVYMRGDSI